MKYNRNKLIYRISANLIALLHLILGAWGGIGAILALNGYYPKHPAAWGIYLLFVVGRTFA